MPIVMFDKTSGQVIEKRGMFFMDLKRIMIANTGYGNSGSSAGVSSLTWNHTVGSGPNRILTVAVSVYKSSGVVAPTSVTYGGVAMTKIADVTSSVVNASLWYLVAPASGTAQVACSFSTTIIGGGVSADYTGVHQTAPLGTAATATGNTTTATVAVTAAVGDLVIDALAKRDTTEAPTCDASQTLAYQTVSAYVTAGSNAHAGMSYEDGAASVTMSWTWPTNNRYWSIIGVALKRA